MTAAYDYEDLHHLVDRLTPEQVRRLVLHVRQDADLSVPDSPSAADASRLSELIGAIDGSPDLAEQHDGYVRNRFSRPT